MRSHFSILKRKWILQNRGSWRTFNEFENICPMWAFLCIMIVIANKERIARFTFLVIRFIFSEFLFRRSILFWFTFPPLFTSSWFGLAGRWFYDTDFGNSFHRKAFRRWIFYGQSLSTFIIFLFLLRFLANITYDTISDAKSYRRSNYWITYKEW